MRLSTHFWNQIWTSFSPSATFFTISRRAALSGLELIRYSALRTSSSSLLHVEVSMQLRARGYAAEVKPWHVPLRTRREHDRRDKSIRSLREIYAPCPASFLSRKRFVVHIGRHFVGDSFWRVYKESVVSSAPADWRRGWQRRRAGHFGQ